jgi:hypothetical protein
MFTDRIELEKRAAMRIIGRALAKGYTVSVCDGEEYTVKRSTNRVAIRAALATTDADTILVRRADGEKIGVIWFVWGNSPEEVAADHTDNAEIRELVD